MIHIFSFLSAFALVLIAIPTIILIAERKNLYDEPDERKVHTDLVPTLGGLAIYGGLLITTLMFNDFKQIPELQYILGGITLLFFLGMKDDILVLSASKKFLGQFIAAFIVVVVGGVKLSSLHGFFWYNEIPEVVGLIVTIFTIVTITNAFNLIDGINCLSGGIGTLIALTLGSWFFYYGELQYAIIAFTLAGSLLGFLAFNKTPAKIFMGDTGSLIVGLLLSTLAIRFIEFNGQIKSAVSVGSEPAVAVGIFIIPLFDTLRVFMMRIMERRSPFSPDRTHVHHRLIDLGFSHMTAAGILIVVNILFIVFAFYFHTLGTMNLLGIMLAMATIISYIPVYVLKKRGVLKS